VEGDRSPVGAPEPLIAYVDALCVASFRVRGNAESPPRHRHRRGLHACLVLKPTEISLARLSPTAKEDDGWWRYRQAVGTKAERRAARAHVTAYHEARLGELIEYITAAVDRYRAGEIDAYDVDEAIHHYHRAARELWKFCWSGGGGTHSEIIAHVLDRMATDGESINWWDRVAPLQRD
jgi:hypothetical protein